MLGVNRGTQNGTQGVCTANLQFAPIAGTLSCEDKPPSLSRGDAPFEYGHGAGYTTLVGFPSGFRSICREETGRYNPTMLWPVEKRGRHGAIRDRMADGSEGSRMRRIKGARHAHAAMRSQGRIPGDEGRMRITENRTALKRDAAEGKGWRVGYTNLSWI